MVLQMYEDTTEILTFTRESHQNVYILKKCEIRTKYEKTHMPPCNILSDIYYKFTAVDIFI